MFVLEIAPVIVNAFYAKLPLHCTLLQWTNFPPEFPRRSILHHIESLCAHYAPIKLVSIGSASNFGPAEKTFVHLVHPDGKLVRLHNDLLYTGSCLSGTLETPRWAGKGYRPHVTPDGETNFGFGKRHTAERVYVVERVVVDTGIRESKQIVARFDLSGPSS